jgi:nucleosome binding factor SPN SPT16 subunit
MQKEMVDIAYPPLIESGGQYTLKLSGLSTDSNMDYGVIVCQAGARYVCSFYISEKG